MNDTPVFTVIPNLTEEQTRNFTQNFFGETFSTPKRKSCFSPRQLLNNSCHVEKTSSSSGSSAAAAVPETSFSLASLQRELLSQNTATFKNGK